MILAALVGVLFMLCVWFVLKKKQASALYTKKRKLQIVDPMKLELQGNKTSPLNICLVMNKSKKSMSDRSAPHANTF